MEKRVTVVGLGCIGTSIGLALREREPDLEAIGYDADGGRAREALRLGAVARVAPNLPAACKEAGLVVLALPLPEVRGALEAIAPHVREGCVVTDTARLKAPVLEWAREVLPEGVHFVTGAPIPGPAVGEMEWLAGPEAARADLFEGGLYCITPDQETHPDAVTVLLGLARGVGARPLFLAPIEYDGLRAGVGDLPALIAVALLRATVDSPGWQDMRKIAGYDFATITGPAALPPSSLWEPALLNRENLLRRLDMFLEELARIRQWLLESDVESLEAAYTQAAEGRARWLKERAEGVWEHPADLGEIPSLGEQLGRLLFGGLFGGRPGGERR